MAKKRRRHSVRQLFFDKRRGGPPLKLTGQNPVSGESPWWIAVAKDLFSKPGMIGKIVSIEELTAMIPDYPDGRRPRPRAVARRLKPYIDVISRGPRGSLGKKSTFIIRSFPNEPIREDAIRQDDEWLLESVMKMTEMVGKKFNK